MKWFYTAVAWCVVAGIGGGVGNGLFLVLSADVNAALLGGFAAVLTLANSFAFQKFRKIDDLNNVAWLDAARRNKVRRFAANRTAIFRARWPACIVFGVLTGIIAVLLKLPQSDSQWILTVGGYSFGFLLVVLATLMNHDYFLITRIHAEMTQKKEDMERRRTFLQKVQT